jgi:hypothetical protein
VALISRILAKAEDKNVKKKALIAIRCKLQQFVKVKQWLPQRR